MDLRSYNWASMTIAALRIIVGERNFQEPPRSRSSRAISARRRDSARLLSLQPRGYNSILFELSRGMLGYAIIRPQVPACVTSDLRFTN